MIVDRFELMRCFVLPQAAWTNGFGAEHRGVAVGASPLAGDNSRGLVRRIRGNHPCRLLLAIKCLRRIADALLQWTGLEGLCRIGW